MIRLNILKCLKLKALVLTLPYHWNLHTILTYTNFILSKHIIFTNIIVYMSVCMVSIVKTLKFPKKPPSTSDPFSPWEKYYIYCVIY